MLVGSMKAWLVVTFDLLIPTASEALNEALPLWALTLFPLGFRSKKEKIIEKDFTLVV